MKLRSWISILLVLSLLIAAVPVNALELPSFGREYVFFADPLNPDAQAPAPEWPERVSPLAINTEEYLSDPEEAAAILRAGMLNRQSEVKIKYRADASIAYADVVGPIREMAMAHTGEPTEGDYLAWQRGNISAPANAYAIGSMYYYDITFKLEYYTTAAQEAEMDTAVAALLDSLDLDGKNDYEKVSTVYQWMCENITYDYDTLNDSSYKLKYTGYAALINRTSVCQGYAVLLYRLCLEMGIDCRVITGTGNGGGHAWNIVELNGKYYNLDATWDDSYFSVLGEFNYFLRCNDTFGDHVRNAEYETDEFNTAYPMDTADFDLAAEPQRTPGDINGDGSVNNKDLTRLFQYLSDWDVDVEEAALDINGDGSVNNKDLTRLFQYLSDWDVEIH